LANLNSNKSTNTNKFVETNQSLRKASLLREQLLANTNQTQSSINSPDRKQILITENNISSFLKHNQNFKAKISQMLKNRNNNHKSMESYKD
jgi:hypothetical protein